MTTGPATITIYGRPGCHLCDDAEERVAQLLGELPHELSDGVRVEIVNIEHDDELHRRYLEKIPVIVVNGTQLAELGQYRRRPFADALLGALS